MSLLEINISDNIPRRRIAHTEKSTIISSNHLTHYTSKFSTLLAILKEGFRPSFCNESPIYRKEYEELLALYNLLEIEIPNIEDVQVPMLCFSDIPQKYSKSHRKTYGAYGISLKKAWAISNWITPVTYVAKDSKNHSLLFSINSQIDRALKFHEHDECNTETNPFLITLKSSILKYMSFVKPYYDTTIYKKYYDEREWRFVPDNYMNEDFNNPDTYLKFDINDIYQIVVTTADERRQVRNLLRKKYNLETRKKLISIRHRNAKR